MHHGRGAVLAPGPGGGAGGSALLRRRRRLRPGRVVQLPDVLLQVKVPAEAFATGWAGEGLLVVVRVHVEGQVVDLVERFAADGALELLLAAVGQLVVLVVSWRKEPETVVRSPGAGPGAGPGPGDQCGLRGPSCSERPPPAEGAVGPALPTAVRRFENGLWRQSCGCLRLCWETAVKGNSHTVMALKPRGSFYLCAVTDLDPFLPGFCSMKMMNPNSPF